MSALLDQLLTPHQRAMATASDPAPRPVWLAMSEEQRRITLHAMVRFGGGFVSRLGEAWQRADMVDAFKLGACFGDVVVKYGPGSDAYADAAGRECAEAIPAGEASESDFGAFVEALA